MSLTYDVGQDCGQVLQDLRQSHRSGVFKSLESRLHQLKQLKRLLDENEKEIYEALYKDLRKCKVEAQIMEFFQVRKEIGLSLEKLEDWMKPERVKSDLMNILNTAEIIREPYGVSLIIGSWNYPLFVTLLPLVGALAAGNCVVVKPSELSPNTSALLEQLFPKYFDEKCVKLINGGVPETSALLRERFDHIFYTGGTAVAKIIMKAAAENLTPVTLELGGKCPAIVDETCNMDVIAQRIAWAKFSNSGQTCLAVDYVICVGKLQEKLIASMKKAIQSFYGEDAKSSDSYGRIINERHYQRICKLIDPGKVAYGNIRDVKELYISPTILARVTAEDLIMQEEIFGPVLPILSVDTVEDAINFVNHREKPLALYVFTKSRKVCDQIKNATSSGGLCWNDALVHGAVDTLPFGGVGHSGMGCYHGKFSFEAFSHRKSCLYKNQKLESINKLRYPPYDENFKLLQYLVWVSTPSGRRSSYFSVWAVAAIGIACGILYHFLS